MEQHRNSLKPGYKLHWYIIRDILGQGGFGITYLAHDANLNQPVAIKEYLPVELAVRENAISVHPVSGDRGEEFLWGLERFITEAQTLARFRHPNIVRVLTVFKENNTAYMVMEYEQGRPLHEILKERKTLPEEELKGILFPILDGLEEVHAENFVHRDIKPANIYIRDDRSPVLLDFGSARQSLGEKTRTLTTMISPGYAPFEQYVSNSRKQGPWTDIYGLGATLYRAVTGIAPPDSMHRSEAILHTGKDIFVSAQEVAAGRYTKEFLAAIDHAMLFKADDRPRTIAEWRDELGGVPSLNTGTVDIDITHPVITTGRGAVTDTLKIDASAVAATLKVDRDATTAVEENPPATVPPEEDSVDRIYGVIKKLLSGLLVLFIILVMALVFLRSKTEDTAQEEEASPPAMDRVIADPPVAAEKKPREAAPDSGQKPAKKKQSRPAEVTQPVAPKATTAVAPENQSSRSRRDELQSLKERLRQDPHDHQAREELKRVSKRYEENIHNAMEGGNYALARDYIREVQSVTAVNSKAWYRLNELMRAVDEKEARAGR